MKKKSPLLLLIFLLYSLTICIADDLTLELPIPERIKPIQNTLITTTFFYAGDKLVAIKGIEGTQYYHSDRLSTTRITTDQIGNKIGETKTLPFGEEILNTNDNRFTFAGKELDEDLYYLGARYYYPDIARFTSVDPVKSESDYQYVGNNPLVFIDPDGRQKFFPAGGMDYYPLRAEILTAEQIIVPHQVNGGIVKQLLETGGYVTDNDHFLNIPWGVRAPGEDRVYMLKGLTRTAADLIKSGKAEVFVAYVGEHDPIPELEGWTMGSEEGLSAPIEINKHAQIASGNARGYGPLNMEDAIKGENMLFDDAAKSMTFTAEEISLPGKVVRKLGSLKGGLQVLGVAGEALSPALAYSDPVAYYKNRREFMQKTENMGILGGLLRLFYGIADLNSNAAASMSPNNPNNWET